MRYQLKIDWQHFLSHYWQKKPVILRQAFVDFQDPISPDELAGLSLEQEIESRLVSNKAGIWDAKYGPFNEEIFSTLGESHWSLLVQAVDHWHDECADLVKPFGCLPQWQFDDLMISYALPGGGVGPHIDQYDVFIIQGMGRRRWRVGDINPDYKQFCRHPALLHVEAFSPIIDEEITAGDILYIPPGFPHDGLCIEESLSYSVGFRTPTSQELLSGFADYILDNDVGKNHYSDPELTLPTNPLTIAPRELSRLKSMMCELINEPQFFDNWFGQHITQSMHEVNLIPVTPEYTLEEVREQFKQNEPCLLVNSIRLLNVADKWFIHGEKIDLPNEVMQTLSQAGSITDIVVNKYLANDNVMQTLTQLINKGYWYFAE